MSEFERIKRTVEGRNIVLTSWFDTQREEWRASAPAYAHLSIVSGVTRTHCSSREAALDLVCGTLQHHFTVHER